MYNLIKKRAKIILELLEKSNSSTVSKSLNRNRKTVIKWKQRWVQSKIKLDRIEKDEPRRLNQAIKELLEDNTPV
ncbi:helix-turn-helix domain-containing protein [Clostridium sp.]|uniref:helix-turn-helix domain-containing protein n=1 Tax=Clostridium sp. TaxID=1506 RepID=UPI00359FFC6B